MATSFAARLQPVSGPGSRFLQARALAAKAGMHAWLMLIGGIATVGTHARLVTSAVPFQVSC